MTAPNTAPGDSGTEIDYEALAKAAHDEEYPQSSWGDQHYHYRHTRRRRARAVVAALGDQGVVVVSKDDLYHYLAGTLINLPKDVGEHPNNVELFTRLAAAIGIDLTALAAPGDGGEDG